MATTPAINTIESLRAHLQAAIEVEHSTVPIYLTALYSIVEGTNEDASRIIRSVVMEEMLHMSMVANVLNAVGGRPTFNNPDFIPKFPAPMPFSDGSIYMRLQALTPDAIALFRQIERPAPVDAPPQPEKFHTLGQFYEAVALGMEYLCETLGEDAVFTGNPAVQIGPEQYYGGGGEIFKVLTLEDALHALRFIIIEGEGFEHGISDGDKRYFGQVEEPAHFFQFNQIRLGRFYKEGDTPESGPSGPPLRMDWNSVAPMEPDPSMAKLRMGTEVYDRSFAFNCGYSALLDDLTEAFNGRPERFSDAIARMYQLKYAADALVNMPVGDKGLTAGPSFEWIPPGERI